MLLILLLFVNKYINFLIDLTSACRILMREGGLMPIYEFKCNECGDKFSKIIIKKDALIECPKCKSNNVSKLMSAFKASTSSSCVNSSFT
jgi:putative FmdB family regulatory protein